MEKLDDSVKQPKYWIPIIWAGSIVTRARKENRIKDDFSLKAVIEELDKYRSKASTLLDYDWITVPLVYTQVSTFFILSNTWFGLGFIHFSFQGRHLSCVLVSIVDTHGTTVLGSYQEIYWPWSGSCGARIYFSSILLLHGVVKGKSVEHI